MQPDQLLYQAFPAELRIAYGHAVQAADWGDRHGALLDFAETALGHLASLCLSDYRTRSSEPVREVEVLLEQARDRPLTFGSLLTLLTASVKAMPDPLLPAPDTFPDCSLEGAKRLHAAVSALEAAVEGLSPGASPAAIDVAVHVERGLAIELQETTWWDSWRRLVTYRNRVAHAARARWPVRGHGYWEVMGPLLHDTIVELLTREPITEAVLGHPVVRVSLIADTCGKSVHTVCGEKRGVWFEQDVIAATPVVERWADENWKASTASTFILDPENGGWEFRSLFWDLGNGLPPAMDMRVGPAAESAQSTMRHNTSTARGGAKAREGHGVAPGTCGEFVQGVLPDGNRFHVTCPINKSASVVARMRPAAELAVKGLSDHHLKLGLAIEYAVEELGLGGVEVTIRHWSDIDIAKGMGSSTADVLAGIRAVADAAGEQFDVATEGRLAAQVESSDGSMYPGIAAVNHKTCELIRAWGWYPEFAIVMLVPHDSVDTPSISFAGQEELAGEYERLLAEMDDAVARRSIADFATQSTQSAALNERFLLNPYSCQLSDRLEEFGALGLNVGHTGSVCGLLFPNTETGRVQASETCFEMGNLFPGLKDIKVVTTPHCRKAEGFSADVGGCARDG